MNTEILVHIAAPSTVHHDKRYRAIAKGVADFKAATLIKIIDHEVECLRPNNDLETSSLHQANTISTPACEPNTHQTGPNEPLSQLEEATLIRKRTRERALHRDFGPPQESRVLDSFILSKDYQTDHSYDENNRNVEPLHKKRCSNNLTDSADRLSYGLRRTPVTARPKTAPATTTLTTAARVLVPCTARSSRRRAMSESYSFSSNGTTVPNSQPSFLHNAASEVSGLLSKVTNPPADSRALVRSIMDNERPAIVAQVEPRAGCDTTSPRRTLLDHDSNHSRESSPPCFFLQDQSLDQMSQPLPPQSSASTSTKTMTPTASPSQEDTSNHVQTNSRPNEGFYLPSSPINLVSPESNVPNQQREDVLSSSQAPPRPAVSEGCHLGGATAAEMIRALEWKIDSPIVGSSTGQFTTDLTPRLKDYDNCRPIRDHFLPMEVSRDIRVLERGFWQIPITIADWSEVEEWRRLTTILREGPVTSKYQNSPWTVEEVLAFHNRLGHDIQSGHLGSVRLFRLGDCVESSNTDVGPVQITLRLYSWGESAAHLYMAMRWLSESKIEYVPAQWIGSDGRTVVTMSGERFRKMTPRLGQWVRKGGKGDQGRYGIAGDND